MAIEKHLVKDSTNASGFVTFDMEDNKAFAVRFVVSEGSKQAMRLLTLGSNPANAFSIKIWYAGSEFTYAITPSGTIGTTAARMVAPIQADSTNGISATTFTEGTTNVIKLVADQYGLAGNRIQFAVIDERVGFEGQIVTGVYLDGAQLNPQRQYLGGGFNGLSSDATVTYNIRTTLTSLEDQNRFSGYSLLQGGTEKTATDIIEAFGWKTILDYSPVVPFSRVTVSWSALTKGDANRTAYLNIFAKLETEA